MQIGTATSAPVETTSSGRSRSTISSDWHRFSSVRPTARRGWQTR